MTVARATWVVALLSCLPFAASTSLAQSPYGSAARIDSVFAAYARPAGPGCAVGISKAGALEYAKGYGLADLESNTPITPATVFNIGSTSKQFVAFAIELLAAQGKLSIDDPVRRFVPEVPDFGTPITIRHLLNHTSGLRDYASLLSLMGWQGGDQYDEGRFLSLISGQRRLNFPPGTRHLYSNTGYVLLATIVSRASGQPWPAFAAERIFGPLGMTKSEVRSDPLGIASDRALGYSPAAGGRWRLDMPNHDITGSTAVMTTVEDLARWTGNYWRPVVGDQSVLAAMHQRGVLTAGDTISYAAGLMAGEYRGLELVDHGGATGGYRAQLLRFPTERVGIAVLCNAGNSNPDGLARQVADRVLENRLAPPRPSPAPVTLSSGDLDSFAGIFADSITDNSIRLARAGDRLTADLGGGHPVVEARGRNELRVGGLTLTAERNAAGVVTALVRSGADGPGGRYNRVQSFAPSGSELDRYTGAYRSAELDRTWRIEARSGALWLARRDFVDAKLEPLFEHAFRGPGFSMRFVPGSEGRFAQLRVSNGRALGVRFDQVPE